MHQVEIAFIEYAKQVHEFYGFPDDTWLFAHKLGLNVVTGDEDALEGKIIMLSPATRSSRRRTHAALRHEIAHHLLQRGGFEEQIFKLRCGYEKGLPSLEKLCYHAALVFQVPDWILEEAEEINRDNGPAVILHISLAANVDLETALERWTYAQAGAKRIAFLVEKGLVKKVATSGPWVPFWEHSSIQDALKGYPGQLLNVGRQRLGAIDWE